MQLNENVSHKGLLNKFTRGDKDAIEGESSFYSVNLRFRVVRLSIEEQRCIPFYQQNRQSLKEMSNTFSFLTPWLPGQSSPQLLDLQLRLHMPPTKGLHWHWDEGQACPPTGVTRSCHLPGEGIVQGVARGGSRLADQSCLQGIDHGHVQCCIPTPGPVGDKDIRRPDLWPRDKCSVLPGGTKSCTYCCVEECVPQVVVSCNGWTAIVLKIANSLQIDQNSLHPHTSASLVHIFIQLVHGAEAVDLALTTKFASGGSGTENWQLLLYVYPSIGSKYQPLPPPQKAS